MADINNVILTGVVPKFEGACRVFNENDEAHATCVLKLNVGRRAKQQDGSYKNVDDTIELHAYGRTAITAKKMALPGKGLLIQARVTPSRPVKRNGQELLDQNGKKIYTGVQLVINDYNGISFARDFSERNGSGNAAAASSAAVADPMAAAMGGAQVDEDPFSTADDGFPTF